MKMETLTIKVKIEFIITNLENRLEKEHMLLLDVQLQEKTAKNTQ
jgi:hypothetical protein